MTAILHTDAQRAAFLMGLNDRLAGKPMMAFGDARDNDPQLNDAYGAGYDPWNEMRMVRPQFEERVAREVGAYLIETGAIIPTPLPRNACEFPS